MQSVKQLVSSAISNAQFVSDPVDKPKENAQEVNIEKDYNPTNNFLPERNNFKSNFTQPKNDLAGSYDFFLKYPSNNFVPEAQSSLESKNYK